MKPPSEIALHGATETALTLPGDLTLQGWEQTGEVLGRIDSARQWWLGDWLNYGERKYGEAYAQGMEATGLEYNTLSNYAWVAREVTLRSVTLSWNHHREVAKYEPEAQEVWLLQAEHEGWSVRELRTALRDFYAEPPPDLPEGQFDVILADPPWRYDHNETPDKREIENQYPTMTVEEIAALGVPAADNAILFLWATNPKLLEALAVMEAWGFQYRTNACWVKDRFGMGYYVRGQHELLLIGRRGDPGVPAEGARPSSIINAPRGEHSRKPDDFYELIEGMYPSQSKVELFARRPRKGWEGWGNQLEVAA